MPKTEKGEKIYRAMQEQYGPEKGKEVFYASRNKGTITGVDTGAMGLEGQQAVDQGPLPSNLPATAIQPNAGPTTMPMNSVPQANSPVTDISYPPDGPKGVLKPIGELPEEKHITTTSAGGPSGTPDNEATGALKGLMGHVPGMPKMDMVGKRQLASGRPMDKQIGTVRDYAAAAGAKR